MRRAVAVVALMKLRLTRRIRRDDTEQGDLGADQEDEEGDCCPSDLICKRYLAWGSPSTDCEAICDVESRTF